MGNISPRFSKSYHDGFSNNVTLTQNRSSWKKQLQIINDKLNIKRYSRRHTHDVNQYYKTNINENDCHQSSSIYNFHGSTLNQLNKQNSRQGEDFKKSTSLFTIKQESEQQIDANNECQSTKKSTSNGIVQRRQKSKLDPTTKNKRHSSFIPFTYQLPKSQSQLYHNYHINLSLNSKNSNTNDNCRLSTSAKSVHTIVETTKRKTIIQASTGELLRCFSEYVCSSCSHLLPSLDPIDCIMWIKSADRKLILQGWQEQVFVNPANIVFVYLIVRDTLTYVIPSITIKSVGELRAIVLTCLYLSFSYMGNEITYPLKPFVTDHEKRDAFWRRVVLLMERLSSKMLAINQNPKFFTECFSELKKYNLVH